LQRIFFKFSVFFAGVEANSLKEIIEPLIPSTNSNSQETPRKKKQMTENHFSHAKQEKITRARMIAMYRLPLLFVQSGGIYENHKTKLSSSISTSYSCT